VTSLAIAASNGEIFSAVAASVSEQSQAGDNPADSSLVAKLIVLLALWVVIRIVAAAVGELLAALAKLVGVLFATAVLFAIVSLSLVAHLTGGEATRHAQIPRPSEFAALGSAPFDGADTPEHRWRLT
jgi:hypothetical protein